MISRTIRPLVGQERRDQVGHAERVGVQVDEERYVLRAGLDDRRDEVEDARLELAHAPELDGCVDVRARVRVVTLGADEELVGEHRGRLEIDDGLRGHPGRREGLVEALDVLAAPP
ncbi:MAG: hypothetical protein IPJ34_44020 [Myxococcales bacterium]|nr:hypothetical protein [Myxococcales bacterium]